jgi:hypothetical protein
LSKQKYFQFHARVPRVDRADQDSAAVDSVARAEQVAGAALVAPHHQAALVVQVIRAAATSRRVAVPAPSTRASATSDWRKLLVG